VTRGRPKSIADILEKPGSDHLRDRLFSPAFKQFPQKESLDGPRAPNFPPFLLGPQQQRQA
jgi:hypothetical protein